MNFYYRGVFVAELTRSEVLGAIEKGVSLKGANLRKIDLSNENLRGGFL